MKLPGIKQTTKQEVQQLVQKAESKRRKKPRQPSSAVEQKEIQ